MVPAKSLRNAASLCWHEKKLNGKIQFRAVTIRERRHLFQATSFGKRVSTPLPSQL